MEENKNQCPFCNKMFETPRKKGCHQRLCELNPKREEMLKALQKGGKITFTKLNKARTLERKEYVCICLKCKKEYTVLCTEKQYIKGKYKKYCSRKCANSRIISEEQKNRVREKLTKHKENRVKEKLTKQKENRICLKCGVNITHKSKSGCCKKCVVRKFSEETKEKIAKSWFKKLFFTS